MAAPHDPRIVITGTGRSGTTLLVQILTDLGFDTGFSSDAPIDDAYQIPDAEALPIIFDLLKHEGLCLGGSSGINVAGAMRLARDLGPGHTIVTILCDGGARYASKLFNPEFLRSQNLPTPAWLEKSVRIDPGFVDPS